MSDPRLEAIRHVLEKRPDFSEYSHDDVAYLVALIDTLQRERDEIAEELESNRACNLYTWKERALKAEAQVSRLTEIVETIRAFADRLQSMDESDFRIGLKLKQLLASPDQEPQP